MSGGQPWGSSLQRRPVGPHDVIRNRLGPRLCHVQCCCWWHRSESSQVSVRGRFRPRSACGLHVRTLRTSFRPRSTNDLAPKRYPSCVRDEGCLKSCVRGLVFRPLLLLIGRVSGVTARAHWHGARRRVRRASRRARSRADAPRHRAHPRPGDPRHARPGEGAEVGGGAFGLRDRRAVRHRRRSCASAPAGALDTTEHAWQRVRMEGGHGEAPGSATSTAVGAQRGGACVY